MLELSDKQLSEIKGLGKKSVAEITQKTSVLLKRGEAAAEGDMREEKLEKK